MIACFMHCNSNVRFPPASRTIGTECPLLTQMIELWITSRPTRNQGIMMLVSNPPQPKGKKEMPRIPWRNVLQTKNDTGMGSVLVVRRLFQRAAIPQSTTNTLGLV